MRKVNFEDQGVGSYGTDKGSIMLKSFVSFSFLIFFFLMWAILKFFIEFFTISFYGHKACRILARDQTHTLCIRR